MHYITSCNTQCSAPEDGRDHRPKHVELIGIITTPLLLHLVGVYIIYVNDAWSNKHQLRECLWLWFENCILSGAEVRTVPFPLRNKKLFISYFPRYCLNRKPINLGGRDSSVGMATRYKLDGPGIESRWGARYSAPVHTGPGGPPSLLYNGYLYSFSGVKRPGRGLDHPPHLVPRLKKEYSYTSTPPLGLRGLF